MNNQQGDIKLFQTSNDGDIFIENGIAEMSGGLETSVYLALFGGNILDYGGQENKYNWWGNLEEQDKSKVYRSETQVLLESLPATSNNLLRLKDAVLRDLEFLIDIGASTDIEVNIRIPALNRVQIEINIENNATEQKLIFNENWKYNR